MKRHLWAVAVLLICTHVSAQTNVLVRSSPERPATPAVKWNEAQPLRLLALSSLDPLPEPAPVAPIVSNYIPSRDNRDTAPRFWDTPNKILLISHYALEAADFGITHRNLAGGGKELSWMAKPLVNQGTPGQITYFAGRSVAVTGMSYLMHKMGHHRLERAFIMLSNADSASGVSYSLAHR